MSGHRHLSTFIVDDTPSFVTGSLATREFLDTMVNEVNVDSIPVPYTENWKEATFHQLYHYTLGYISKMKLSQAQNVHLIKCHFLGSKFIC